VAGAHLGLQNRCLIIKMGGKFDSYAFPQTNQMKKKIFVNNIRYYYLFIILFIILFFFIYQNFKQLTIDKSLIILPFYNTQTTNQSNYFSDGITEDIINKLSVIDELHIISREISLQYEDTRKLYVEIAKKHNISNILKGEIFQSNDSIFIKCNFININSNNFNWEKIFSGNKNDIFQIQSEIVNYISNSLNIKLNLSERRIINSSQITNFEAYEYYLKGIFEFHKHTYNNYDQSINFYNKALQLDPFNSKLYSVISNSYTKMYNLNRSELYKDLAISASERAIKINDKFPEGYISRANILTLLGRLDEAYNFNKKASKLNNLVGGNENNALIAQWRGDLSEALKLYKNIPKKENQHEGKALVELSNIYYLLGKKQKAKKLVEFGLKNQPNSFDYNQFFIIYESFEKNKDIARKYLYRLQMLRPNDSRVNTTTGLYYLWFRDYNKSLSYFQKVKFPWLEDKIAIAYILRQKWDKKWSDSILDEVYERYILRIENGDNSSQTSLNISMIFAIKEDFEKAFFWLEKSVIQGFLWVNYLEIDPRFDKMKNDKRFDSILEKIKLKLITENNEVDSL